MESHPRSPSHVWSTGVGPPHDLEFQLAYLKPEGNLYVGTSAAEILHFVSISEELPDKTQSTSYILASRLEPLSALNVSRGVEQILLLPRVNKACILCNGTLTFYSLPELSPAFGNVTKVSNCSWVGGRDLNLGKDDEVNAEVIMMCVKNRIWLVRIGDERKLVKKIEYPGCLASARRGRFACVADTHSYALLDLENQQKIPLFPISSLHDDPGTTIATESEPASSLLDSHAGSNHLLAPQGIVAGDAGIIRHGRTTSLSALVGNLGKRQQNSRSRSRERGIDAAEDARGQLPQETISVPIHTSDLQNLNRLTQSADQTSHPTDISRPNQVPQPTLDILQPHICSPISTEFLLTTGTSYNEPGVGVFVNCEGDVVRGTLEFSQYPSSIVIDGGDDSSAIAPESRSDSRDGYALASVRKCVGGLDHFGIEIQRWDINDNEGKSWLDVSGVLSRMDDDSEPLPATKSLGLGTTFTATDLAFPEVGHRLRSQRLKIFERLSVESPEMSDNVPGTASRSALESWEIKRNRQEEEFARQLGRGTSFIVTSSGSSILWITRNPLALRLDAVVEQVILDSLNSRLDQGRLIKTLRAIRDQEAKTETEFLSLQYIRQKIGVILFADLAANRYDVDPNINQDVFLEGGLDPRVILSMIPFFRPDIFEGPQGIWIHAGLVEIVEHQLLTAPVALERDEVLSRPEEFDLLNLIRKYLSAWRQRKGFGSIVDEAEVFSTVDAALLHVLLYQDQQLDAGPGRPSAVRTELYTIVDHGFKCFDRAVELLEEFRRLYVLSRLYHSRSMTENVLATWRRIIDGETDEGGELVDGENEVRKYLVKIKDLAVVEDYGTWLAKRNPALGVQVFTDDRSKVRLPPNQVVQLLQLKAPESVKVYLEHLVFGKKNVQYANDLISYYLHNVLTILKSSEQARLALSNSYEAYRALSPPKPTYRQFIMDNAVPAAWWYDRLRLLELLGGTHGAGFSYDVSHILERIEPFEEELVPESIILDGRQGRHRQALRLLTHGLGDYHTAINYCLLGGSSIFHPTSSKPVEEGGLPSREEQSVLFRYLFAEFLRIEDRRDRYDRTSELLERFGSWFDVADVVDAIPDEWSVKVVSAFMINAFRRLVQDKSEAMIKKALSGAQNLQVSADFIEKCEKLGPYLEVVQ